MCDPVTAMVAMAATTAVGTGAKIYQGAKDAKRNKAANAQAMKDAADTKAANERAINQANQKSPNLAAIFGANRAATSGGVGSTSLTGSRGVSMDKLALGGNTILGR